MKTVNRSRYEEKKFMSGSRYISHASMVKLGKNKNVTTDVLVKICIALDCDISDIVEIDEPR
jgi:DNA-binding Xre family transcriptional regulator